MQLVEKQILNAFQNHRLWVLQDCNHLAVVQILAKGGWEALGQSWSAKYQRQLTVEGSEGVVPKVHVGPCGGGGDPPYALSTFFLGLENGNGVEHRVHHHLFSSLHRESFLHHLPSSFAVLGGPFRLSRGRGLPGDRLCPYLRDGVCVHSRGYGVPCLCLGHDNGPCFD